MGGSTGKSKSESGGSQSSKEQVWDEQTPYLKDLYGQAGNLFGTLLPGLLTGMQGWAGYLDPINKEALEGAQGGMEQLLGGGSYGQTEDIRNQLLDSLRQTSGGSQMGKMYESITGGPGNTYIDPMVDAMKQSSMQNLDRMQAGTGLDAAAMGQSGGSRHAMQNAMQASQMNQDMLDRETAMRGGAYDKDLAMKMDIAKQADLGMGQSQDRLMQMLSGADRNIQAGIGAGQNLQNLGMGGMAPYMQAAMAPWQMMSQWGNVLGPPVVLGSSRGSQKGSSKGKSAGGSLFG
jgi:hypothetical protein